MKMRYAVVLLLACTLLVPHLASAQWQVTWGPFGFNFQRVTCYAEIGPVFFAGTLGDGLWKSTDNSMSDYTKLTGPPGTNVSALLADAGNLFAATDSGVYKSTDGGDSWTAVDVDLTSHPLTSLVKSGSKMYAASIGLSVSTDGGDTWNQAAGNGFYIISYISQLAVSGSDLYAGTYGGGVYKSTNDGGDWTAVNNGLGGTNIANLVAADGWIYAATSDVSGRTIYRTSDNGGVWTPAMSGFPSFLYTALYAVGWDVFAGPSGGGIYRASNADTAWTAVNEGFSGYVNVFGILGGDLFAALLSGSNYRRGLSQVVTDVVTVPGPVPAAYALAQNYPNPFNPQTTIAFDVPAAGRVRLAVYDLLGREAAVLSDGHLGAGRHVATFDAGELAGGFYLYRLTAGTFTATGKMLLVK